MSEGEKEGLIYIVHQKALAFIQCTHPAMKSLQSNLLPIEWPVLSLVAVGTIQSSLQFILGARPILTRLIKIGDEKLFSWSCGKNL